MLESPFSLVADGPGGLSTCLVVLADLPTRPRAVMGADPSSSSGFAGRKLSWTWRRHLGYEGRQRCSFLWIELASRRSFDLLTLLCR